jgi:type II secretion system protein G
MFRAGGAIVLAILMLSGCGKREADAERQQQGEVGNKGREAIDIAKIQIGLFVTAFDRYKLSLGDFPTTQQGLQALRTPPPDLSKPKKWNGPYLNSEISLHPLNLELPLDPWGHPYHYHSPGTHNPDSFDVWSVGPDGVDGSQDDIGNWKLGPHLCR